MKKPSSLRLYVVELAEPDLDAGVRGHAHAIEREEPGQLVFRGGR